MWLPYTINRLMVGCVVQRTKKSHYNEKMHVKENFFVFLDEWLDFICMSIIKFLSINTYDL